MADIAALEVNETTNMDQETPMLPSYAITTGKRNICHQWNVLREEYMTNLAPAYDHVSDGSLSAGSLKGIDKSILHSKECLELLNKLPKLERRYSDMVASSKYRDDDRGVSIIPNYADVNKSMRQAILSGEGGDDIVVNARNRAIAVEDACMAILGDKYVYEE